MRKIIHLQAILLLAAALAVSACNGGAEIAPEDAYIIDRTGERWSLDQAVTLGYRPGGFEFGLGRNAIVPLSDDRVQENPQNAPDDLRVIGVVVEGVARAYAVAPLRRHEVVNSVIGDTAFAAAY